MTRILAGSIVCFLAMLGVANAVPARRPYEPPPSAPATPDLRGTTWSGYNDVIKANWTVLFEPDGTFNYTYNGNTYRVGT